jgi:hypothetical protein
VPKGHIIYFWALALLSLGRQPAFSQPAGHEQVKTQLERAKALRQVGSSEEAQKIYEALLPQLRGQAASTELLHPSATPCFFLLFSRSEFALSLVSFLPESALRLFLEFRKIQNPVDRLYQTGLGEPSRKPLNCWRNIASSPDGSVTT